MASETRKVVVHLRATGDAPILKQAKFKIAGADKFVKVIDFLRRQLHRETLFVYVNSAFSPNPDELVIDLYNAAALTLKWIHAEFMFCLWITMVRTPHDTSSLLHLCHYKVTFMELASAAISILSSGKVKFDVVMANINSPDLYGFNLLQLAVNTGLPIIAMSYNDDTLVAMRALENGALLFIKKPTTMEVLRSLWQHVLREKACVMKRSERLQEITETEKKFKGRRECTDWTPELHAKFMNAIQLLGEGRCFPKEILNLMNVDGLTRLQVASHLQKCRNLNWRVEAKRPYRLSQHEDGSLTNPRKFGAMPRRGRDDYHVPVQETHLDGQNAGTENIISNTYNVVHGNMEISPASNDKHQYYVVSPHHQQHGALLPDASGTSNPSEDLYNFLDMNGFNHNFSGRKSKPSY